MTRVDGTVGIGPGWPPTRAGRDLNISVRAPFRTTIDGTVVEPVFAPIRVSSSGKFSVTLEPGFWLWLIQHGSYKSVRALEVPDSETADYEALVEVDPGTLVPLAPIPPNAQDILDTAEQAALDAAAAVELFAPGQAGGTATLDGAAKLPETQVPERLSEASLSATIDAEVAPVYFTKTAASSMVADDVGAESARTYLSIPPGLLVATQGTPGGLDHYAGLPVYRFRTTTGDERASSAVIDIPGHWAKMEIAVQYVNLTTTAQTGDVRWRYEEGSPTASTFALTSVVGVVDTAQAAGVLREVTMVTGRTIPANRRVVIGITRTNSNVADTLNDAVGVVAILVRESA